MLCSEYTVEVVDPVLNIRQSQVAQADSNRHYLLKSILKDIGVWQGTRSGRKWPKWECFKNSPIDRLEFSVTEKFLIVAK